MESWSPTYLSCHRYCRQGLAITRLLLQDSIADKPLAWEFAISALWSPISHHTRLLTHHMPAWAVYVCDKLMPEFHSKEIRIRKLRTSVKRLYSVKQAIEENILVLPRGIEPMTFWSLVQPAFFSSQWNWGSVLTPGVPVKNTSFLSRVENFWKHRILVYLWTDEDGGSLG